jgi:hypothetical protein
LVDDRAATPARVVFEADTLGLGFTDQAPPFQCSMSVSYWQIPPPSLRPTLQTSDGDTASMEARLAPFPSAV